MYVCSQVVAMLTGQFQGTVLCFFLPALFPCCGVLSLPQVAWKKQTWSVRDVSPGCEDKKKKGTKKPPGPPGRLPKPAASREASCLASPPVGITLLCCEETVGDRTALLFWGKPCSCLANKTSRRLPAIPKLVLCIRLPVSRCERRAYHWRRRRFPRHVDPDSCIFGVTR